jgi:hypothetical protein
MIFRPSKSTDIPFYIPGPSYTNTLPLFFIDGIRINAL